jgi:hypothetical protein
MLVFRSEDHVDRWCAQWQRPRGGMMTLEQQWDLAVAWHAQDRRDPSWRRRTPAEVNAVFEGIGLTSDFWKLS